LLLTSRAPSPAFPLGLLRFLCGLVGAWTWTRLKYLGSSGLAHQMEIRLHLVLSLLYSLFVSLNFLVLLRLYHVSYWQGLFLQMNLKKDIIRKLL